MLAVVAQPALAQGGLGSVSVQPGADNASTTPGGKATFRVELRNGALLDQNVALIAVTPVGWTFNVTPANVTLSPGAATNVTLDVFLPADAAVNKTTAIPLEARTHGTELVLGRAAVNVTVVAPPPAPVPGAAPPPALLLETSTASGSPGQTVEGVLTLQNQGTSTLDVALAGQGPTGWNPRFLSGDGFHVLHAGEAPRDVRVFASIPPDVAPGSVQPLTIVATVGGVRLTATWNVTVVPTAAPDTSDEPGSDDGTGASDTGSSSSSTQQQEIPRVENPPSAALQVQVVESLLQVSPGASTRGTLRLENTGTLPLSLRLAGVGPTDWPAPLLDRAMLDLPAGATADVGFTLNAPEDVIPSATGRGAGSITATSTGGLLRSAGFTVMVVPGAPRDDTPSDTETSAATVTGGEGTPLPLATIGLAAGFGAVGAGAVALANRPLREKLLWGAVGLYTRLARPDVLGHEDREKLYKLIEATPGVHFHALQRDLAWNTGTLTYHLRVLEKHGFVVDRRDGLYRRFYLSGAAPRKETFENQGPSGLRADVLEAIRNRHGMSQSDLALALGANKQTVNYHVKALERQGLIRLEKRGRETFLYPGGPVDVPGENRRARV